MKLQVSYSFCAKVSKKNNISSIKKYIQGQEKADIALDKLSVKEGAAPFN